VLFYFFASTIALETAHSVSPIVLAWSHAELRRMMLHKWRKSIALSLLVFVVACAIGAATSAGWTSYHPGLHQIYHLTDLSNPMPVLVWIYYIWSIYHFGMQNFGIARIYRVRNRLWGSRYIDMILLVGGTAFLYAGLQYFYYPHWMFFFSMGAISFNHWFAEIGLCGRVSGRPLLFTATVLAIGAIGFVWLKPTPNGNLMNVMPMIICARLGLGFVHFLYDRWIWKFSDLRVRAVIGPPLGLPTAECSPGQKPL
jgi:hypothetical protein